MRTVGIDVGGTSVRAGVVDDRGAVLETVRVPTPDTNGELDDAIVGLVEDLRSRHGIDGVGLAVAGFVDTARRTVLFAPHLAWRHEPVAERFAERTGLPVTLEHDANAATVAEHRFGAARGTSVVLLIALGTGIGAGLLLDGRLYRGAHGVAPELGHLRLVPGGRDCPCGGQGCWERYCSGTALAATATELLARHPDRATVLGRDRSSGPEAVTGERVAEAAHAGDPVARWSMDELGSWLGAGLALAADVYDPELVVLAGGVAGSAALFLGRAREDYSARLTGAGHRPRLRLAVTELGEDAAIVGAATLAREQLVVPRG